jgi:hypothetical protein
MIAGGPRHNGPYSSPSIYWARNKEIEQFAKEYIKKIFAEVGCWGVTEQKTHLSAIKDIRPVPARAAILRPDVLPLDS